MTAPESEYITERLAVHLRPAKIKLTEARRALFLVLYWDGPCSVKQLISNAHLRLARASIYRNLGMFKQAGVAQEVAPGLYALTDRFHQHRHFRVCRICGKRTAFYDERIEKALHRLDFRDSKGFALEEHSLELTGTCGLCQLSGARSVTPVGTAIRRSPRGVDKLVDRSITVVLNKT